MGLDRQFSVGIGHLVRDPGAQGLWVPSLDVYNTWSSEAEQVSEVSVGFAYEG